MKTYNNSAGSSEMLQAVHKTNIEKLADYINGQSNPKEFVSLLLTFGKPSTKRFSSCDQEP